MGMNQYSGTPVETQSSAEQAGGTSRDLFTSRTPRMVNFMGHTFPVYDNPASIEDVYGRLGAIQGRLATEGMQNIGISAPELSPDMMAAATAILNPTRFDASTMLDLLNTERTRSTNRVARQAANTAGTAGMRFSGAADRASRDAVSEVTRGYDIADQQLLATENARVQQQLLQGLSALLGAFNQQAESGAALGANTNQALAQILRFINPQPAEYAPDPWSQALGAGAGLGSAYIGAKASAGRGGTT